MINYHVQIDLEGLASTAKHLRAIASITPQEVASASNLGIATAVRKNFIEYGLKNPNRLKGKSTRYWLRASQATYTEAIDSSVLVGVSTVGDVSLRGVSRHYNGGGTIYPSGKPSEITGRPIRRLTIPARAEAHGKTVATLRAMGVNLYASKGTLRKQEGVEKSDNDPIYYYLAKKVGPQLPDPRVYPFFFVYKSAAEEAIADLIEAKSNG